MMRNDTRVMAYHAIMDMFPDKKHKINGDTLPKMVHADLLTGYIDAIPVSGDFHKAHNIVAIVSGSPYKRSSIALRWQLLQ
jgi:hypothetical protein